MGCLAIITAACAEEAWACSTCFGDPESPMAKGAVVGVAVLLGVIVAVLGGVAGVGLFWVQRSRRLGGLPPTEGPLDS
jgi:hypothetical protein